MDDYTNPDYNKIALFTIDVQRDCTLQGAPIEIPGTFDILPKIQSLVHAFRKSHKSIIHAVRIYLPDGSNSDACRRKSIELGKRIPAPGTDGVELMEELRPAQGIRLDTSNLLKGRFQSIGPKEWIMYKPRWGAFFKTPLEQQLHNLDITTIALCGCHFPNCSRTTMYEASERDFRIVFITDAVSQTYKRGLQELTNIGVNLIKTKEVVTTLAKC